MDNVLPTGASRARHVVPGNPSEHPHQRASWRRERLRTNLWLVPTVEALLISLLFAATITLDRLAYDGRITFADWVLSGTADGARQILTTIAAALITVVGLVFSITIVALTLASTHFGPRMLRTFIRDRATQLTLGTFVATFSYTVLALVAISPGPHGDFAPHLSTTLALGFTLVDLGMLIYFIHHIATMIQLPQVIAVIADDLARAIAAQSGADRPPAPRSECGPGAGDLLRQVDESGTVIPTPVTGYLQFLKHDELVRLAEAADAVLHLPYRPGHFLVQGQPLAVIWPPVAAPQLDAQLPRVQVTGPYRTLTQDVSFGFDQLVEIAIRTLSPAVNDTFTALTCIDWLSHCLCRITHGWHPQRVHRDQAGRIRVIAYQADYDRLVQRASREDPPVLGRHARRDDPPVGRAVTGHGADHDPAPARGPDGAGRDDLARLRSDGARAGRSRARAAPLRGTARTPPGSGFAGGGRRDGRARTPGFNGSDINLTTTQFCRHLDAVNTPSGVRQGKGRATRTALASKDRLPWTNVICPTIGVASPCTLSHAIGARSSTAP